MIIIYAADILDWIDSHPALYAREGMKAFYVNGNKGYTVLHNGEEKYRGNDLGTAVETYNELSTN